MTTTRTRLTIGALVACLAAGAALLFGFGSAVALPPGGAGDSTQGTESSVTPTVQVGGEIGFALTGFPPGEVVYIKIDDGALAGGDSSVQGQGVVHSQVIGADGSVAGSFVLPSYVAPGQHWLRFLASQPRQGHGGGVIGFTNRSPEFTVVAAASGGAGAGGTGGAGAGVANEAPGTGAERGGEAGQAAGAGGTGAAAGVGEGTAQGGQGNVGSFAAATSSASAQPSQSAAARGSASASQPAAAGQADSATPQTQAEPGGQAAQAGAVPGQGGERFPLVGAVVLGVSVVIVGAGLAVLVARTRSSRSAASRSNQAK